MGVFGTDSSVGKQKQSETAQKNKEIKRNRKNLKRKANNMEPFSKTNFIYLICSKGYTKAILSSLFQVIC